MLSQKKNQSCKNKRGSSAIEQDCIIHIGVLGQFQQGKSTLSRLLIPHCKFQMGDGTTPTTQKSTGQLSNCLSLKIWDTPGSNAEDSHEKQWQSALLNADIVIFVKMTEKDLDENDYSLITLFQQYQIPTVFVLNCKSLSHERNNPLSAENHPVVKNISAGAGNMRFNPVKTFYINLGWAALGAKCLETEEWKVAQIASSYRDNFPEDLDMTQAYQRSNFELMRRYLLDASPELFSSDGILVASIKGRIAKCMRASKSHGT